MLSHSIDRFYVVTKFTLPIMDDCKISPITHYMHCSYLIVQLDKRIHAVKHIQHRKHFGAKIVLCLLLKKED